MEDKPLFDALFRTVQPKISELTFAGLYLFRLAHAYRVSRLGDAVVITGAGYDNMPHAFPPLGGDSTKAARILLADGWELYGADEEMTTLLSRDMKITAGEDRDNFDYLYRRSDLSELPGNRYHKKKNRIAYFTKRHLYTLEKFDSAHRAGCLALLEQWQQVHARLENDSFSLETAATAEALATTEELGLEGVVVLVEGEVKAFALGERLNATTAVCHFEKADPFLDGISQLVNREFSRRLFTDCEYVNREQDLGEANLRQAKLSYHPVELVRKYRLLPATHPSLSIPLARALSPG
jgi:uncharacterized protein